MIAFIYNFGGVCVGQWILYGGIDNITQDIGCVYWTYCQEMPVISPKSSNSLNVHII